MNKVISRMLWFLAGLMIGASMAAAMAQDTTINYKGQPVPSAIAPSMSAFSQDVCAIPVSGAVSSTVIGFSGGSVISDKNCERIKLSKVLNDLGLKVTAVAILCQDERVWEAMEMSGSPCPIGGAIGDAARRAWYDMDKKRFTSLYGDSFVLRAAAAEDK